MKLISLMLKKKNIANQYHQKKEILENYLEYGDPGKSHLQISEKKRGGDER